LSQELPGMPVNSLDEGVQVVARHAEARSLLVPAEFRKQIAASGHCVAHVKPADAARRTARLASLRIDVDHDRRFAGPLPYLAGDDADDPRVPVLPGQNKAIVFRLVL